MVGRIDIRAPLGFFLSDCCFQNLLHLLITLTAADSGWMSYKFSSLIGFFQPCLIIPSNHENVIILGKEAFNSGDGLAWKSEKYANFGEFCL